MHVNYCLTLYFLSRLELFEALPKSSALDHDHQRSLLLYRQVYVDIMHLFFQSIIFRAPRLKTPGKPLPSLHLPAFRNGVMAELLPYVINV